MSEFERGKFYPKKKFSSQRETSAGRSFFNSKNGSSSSYRHDKDSTKEHSFTLETPPKIKQPTILLKAREQSDDICLPKRTQRDSEGSGTMMIASSTTKETEVPVAPTVKQMKKSMKLLDDGVLFTESLHDFVQENNDFLVIGIVGAQGVGKSTILNLLANKTVTDDIKKSIFKSFYESSDEETLDNIKLLTQNLNNFNLINGKEKPTTNYGIFNMQTTDNIESNQNATQGIDFFITSSRVILLDCQPFISVAVLEDLIQSDSKRTNLVSEFIPLENSGEIQGLQLTAFLMSVCHVLIVVQDWFFDSNVIRFIQSAEMLKPTISNPEDELTDHLPHLLLVHNKAQMEDFSPNRFKTMQQVYRSLFNKTKLHIDSNLGLGSGRIINSLNPENCGKAINLFLVPEFDPKFENMYNQHPPLADLIKRLRANILGASKHALTHVQLTEKTWLVYCSKVWDNVKKSSFFVEYTKRMP